MVVNIRAAMPRAPVWLFVHAIGSMSFPGTGPSPGSIPVGGLSGWVGRRFCFLLPESQWYPIPNSTFGHTYPDKRPTNFATAQISLHLPKGWTGTTQGQLTSEELSNDSCKNSDGSDFFNTLSHFRTLGRGLEAGSFPKV